jgi:hypothetical protein
MREYDANYMTASAAEHPATTQSAQRSGARPADRTQE